MVMMISYDDNITMYARLSGLDGRVVLYFEVVARLQRPCVVEKALGICMLARVPTHQQLSR